MLSLVGALDSPMPPLGMGEMLVLDESGDTKIMWDANQPMVP